MNGINYIVSILRVKITSSGLTKFIRFPSCDVRVNCILSIKVVFNGTKFKFSIKIRILVYIMKVDLNQITINKLAREKNQLEK